MCCSTQRVCFSGEAKHRHGWPRLFTFHAGSGWTCGLVTRQPRGRELLAPETFSQTLLTLSKGPTRRKLTFSSVCREEPGPPKPEGGPESTSKEDAAWGPAAVQTQPWWPLLLGCDEFLVSPLQFAQGLLRPGRGGACQLPPSRYLSCSIVFLPDRGDET